MAWILLRLSNYQQVAPLVRTGGSRHTGLAAPPHRNNHFMAAVHLSYLNEEEQDLICQVAEQEGKKIRPKQAEQLRKQNGKIDREAAENVFRCPEKSRAEKKTVRIWIDAGVYNTYLADVGEADISEIMEKALKMYFGKAV